MSWKHAIKRLRKAVPEAARDLDQIEHYLSAAERREAMLREGQALNAPAGNRLAVHPRDGAARERSGIM